MLLRSGANPNVPNTVFGRTPLHYAVDYEQIKLVKLITHYNSDPFIKDFSGKNCIELAKTTHMKDTILKAIKSKGRFSDQTSPNSTVSLPGNDSFTEKLKLSPFSSRANSLTRDSNFKYRDQLSRPPNEKLSLKHFRDSKSLLVSRSHSLLEPDAEKAGSDISSSCLLKPNDFSFGISDKRPHLYNWLVSYRLEELFDVLIESGYDDIDQMISQLNSTMPITEETLKAIGVSKSGLRRRLLAAMSEELKAIKSPRPLKSNNSPGIFKCCVMPASANLNLNNTPSLQRWLEGLNLEHLYPLFIDAGYEELEHMLVLMNTSFEITDEILKNEVQISKAGHRHRVLSKLKEDCTGFLTFRKGGDTTRRREDPIIERTSASAACGACTLM